MAGKASSQSIISLPKGGGALQGLGEKFSPDLHTGTGNFTIPISLPPGRNSFQPALNLSYSTGSGNGYFGVGWSLSVPGVTRKTSKGIPRYRDRASHLEDRDVFVLSGAEDLVELGSFTDEAGTEAVRYRPRTEGLFAEILRYHNAAGSDYWRVRTKDGFVSYYGTSPDAGEHPQYSQPVPAERDPAVVMRPDRAQDIFRWHLTLTKDPFGNRIEYLYATDSGSEVARRWKQPILESIRYVDYGSRTDPSFLITVTFDYGDRPDAFSEYRSGFEIRTSKRCKSILIETHADADYKVRSYEFEYQESGPNGLSLLARVNVVGFDDAGAEARELPPLDYGYSSFRPEDPRRRNFLPVKGELPPSSLANPNLELVDLFGNALPDILEMNGVVRYWRNLGNGRFDTPRPMMDAPAGLALADAGVQLLDADGDGRTDLMVTEPGLSGYFPLRFGAKWDRRSMRKYRVAPSFSLEDPEVRLVDLTGDGVTDAIRSGARLECFFNDAEEGWTGTRFVERKALEAFPNVNFSDARVKWSDMSGDGLVDIVFIHDGNVEYWPNLGHGDWGRRIAMRGAPRLPFGYDPRRILVGDVDGDGLADIVYVDDRKIRLWINRSGNEWSEEIVVAGTPPVSDMDAVRLTDLLGSGVGGILWSRDARTPTEDHYFFLDLTGGTKPYVLNEMKNNTGAVTKVGYAPSTRYYLEDERRRETRWETPLPIPVQVVAQVEIIDELSRGKLTTEYRYHKGYRDGLEGEFRGFGFVEQLDSEAFDKYALAGLHGPALTLAAIDREYFSPPTLTKCWFHQGAVEDQEGGWGEAYPERDFWQGDSHLLEHKAGLSRSLTALARKYAHLPSRERRRITRDALRALRGNVLRTELYALDGSSRELRPYTVTENAYDVREESPDPSGVQRPRIFFPHLKAQRTTEWERGDDPLTQFNFAGTYDAVGQRISETDVAVPRRTIRRIGLPGGGTADETHLLATHTRTRFAAPDRISYIRNRVAAATQFTLRDPPGVTEVSPNDLGAVLRDQYSAAVGIHRGFEANLAPWTASSGEPVGHRIVAHSVHHYDGIGFTGLAPGSLGRYGALTRTNTLILTDEILSNAYGNPSLVTAQGRLARTNGVPVSFDDELGYQRLADPDHVTGLYTVTTLQQFDFQSGGATAQRGRVVAMRDCLGHQTDVIFDAYDLLPVTVVDAIGLTMKAAYNYRVLKPALITNVNENRTSLDFSPLGLVSAVWIMGKASRTEGDSTEPSTRFEYDFRAFDRSAQTNPALRQPIFARSIRRTHHDTDPDDVSGTIEATEYTDGFGRILQIRTQAEDEIFGDLVFGGGEALLPAAQNDSGPQTFQGANNADAQNPNVVVSGWQRYDNKGRVVEKYEPFFARGWRFSPVTALQLGEKSTTFYDPRGQAVRTVNPDGSEQRTINGIPDTLADPTNPESINPTRWEIFTYDANDNSGRTHPNSSAAYRHHADTPSSVLIDALGRTVMVVERMRDKPGSSTAPLGGTVGFSTRSTYDIQGALLLVTDALGRTAIARVYDLLQRPLRTESIDSGSRVMVIDAVGNLVEARDDRRALTLRSYDALNRLAEVRARDGQGRSLTLRERLVYGDGGIRNQPQTARIAARGENRLGELYQYFDEAGLVTRGIYDFKGNLLEKERKVFSDQTVLTGLTTGSIESFTVDWISNPLLDEAQPFQTSTRFDALNRVKEITYPRDVNGRRRKLTSRYNRAGALESIGLDNASYVSRVAYNAKNQRVLITYANNVMTRYAYDQRTFRLLRIRTERFDRPNVNAYRRRGEPLQDHAYSYDVSGNLIGIRERVPGCGVQGSVEGSDLLTRSFEYDPLYRLARATGREADNIAAHHPWDDLPHHGLDSGNHGTPTQDNAPMQTRLYWEAYAYDPVGNMTSMTHGEGIAGPTSWVRRFGVSGFTPREWRSRIAQFLAGATPDLGTEGNRLTNVGNDTQQLTHQFDENGNLVREFTNRRFAWDHADRLIGFADRPAGAAAASKSAVYLYDASGQRIKKIVRRGGAAYETTVYIDGVFEYHADADPGGAAHNNSLHVMDDQRRIALIRLGDPLPGDRGPRVKYHLGDHLRNSSVVVGGVDAASNTFVNREEYYPFGESSFGSFGRKRYRFTGQERDQESGLNYHGARYYAGWLARWTSCDAIAKTDELNLYAYVRNRPLGLTDRSGYAGEEDFSSLNQVMSEASQSQPLTKVLTKPQTPIPKNTTPTNYSSAAAQGRKAYNAANPVAPGNQAHHWTKEITSGNTQMPRATMNQNMSHLQAQNALQATTMLQDPRGGGTRYSVPGETTYGNEHKFADRSVILAEEAKSLPSANPRNAAAEAGQAARWRMTGEPGPGPGTEIPIGKIQTQTAAAPKPAAAAGLPKTGGGTGFANAAGALKSGIGALGTAHDIVTGSPHTWGYDTAAAEEGYFFEAFLYLIGGQQGMEPVKPTHMGGNPELWRHRVDEFRHERFQVQMKASYSPPPPMCRP